MADQQYAVTSLPRRGFTAGAGAALASFAIVRPPVKAAQFEVKCASDSAVDHPSSVHAREMWAAIEQESRGRIHAAFFPASQLGNDTSVLSQLRLNAVQFFLLNPVVFVSIVPAADIVNVGFAFKDEDEAFRAMDGQLGEYLRGEIAAKGLYALKTIGTSGMRHVTSSSHPIRNADDFNGFKIRVPNSKIVIDLFKTMGASTAPLPVSEVYTAMQTHLVDGYEGPVASILRERIYEVQKYLSMTNHVWGGFVMLVNGEWWKSLPADLQQIVERNNTKYTLLERRDTKALNASGVQQLTQRGMTVNQVDLASIRAKLRPYYEACANDFGPTVWSMLQRSISGKLT